MFINRSHLTGVHIQRLQSSSTFYGLFSSHYWHTWLRYFTCSKVSMKDIGRWLKVMNRLKSKKHCRICQQGSKPNSCATVKNSSQNFPHKQTYLRQNSQPYFEERNCNEWIWNWSNFVKAAAACGGHVSMSNGGKKKEERIYVKIFYHFDGLCLLCLHYTHQIWCNISLILVQKLSWIFCKSKMPPNLLL